MASKADRTIPDLANATPGFLVDEIGRMRAEAARLKFLDGIFKQALEARVTPKQLEGGKFIEGEKFLGDYEEKTQERIDTEAVREYFIDDPVTLKKLTKVITFTQLNTKPKHEF